MARKVKKSFEQIETEILMEYLNSDDTELEKIRRKRRLGQIDENGEPETNPNFDI